MIEEIIVFLAFSATVCMFTFFLVSYISVYCFVLLPIVGIPWLIFAGPRWFWYDITDAESRIISKKNAILEFTNFHWQKPSIVLAKILDKYDGKLLTASGTMGLGNIYGIIGADVKSLYPIFEDKVEITTNPETGEEKTQIWFRLKSKDGGYPSESTNIVQTDGLSLA